MPHPMLDWQRTVGSAMSVLEYLRSQRPHASLVVPSSAAVYGMASEMPTPVHAALRPHSPYGTHKAMTEDLCRSYARHFGTRAAVVRYFSLYGICLRKQLLC